MASNPGPVAVVTGANRGIGKEVARQLLERGMAVALTARDREQADATAEELAERTGGTVCGLQLDVTDDDAVLAAAAWVTEHFGHVDALVNNAGVMADNARRPGVLYADPAAFLLAFNTNALGAFRVSRAFAPLVQRARGCIVNVSSGMGGITEMGGGHPAYRLSKASLNALTRVLHAELHGAGVRVNAVCPGWVRTDMGGPSATRPVEDGAAGVVWAATLDPDGPSGGFFRDGRAIRW